MPRSTLDEQIESGLLTAPSAAEVMPMSRTTIANLGRRAVIKRIVTPGIRETRFSALELMRYVIANQLPLNPRLRQAAENYAARYSQQEEYHKLFLQCKPTIAKPNTEVVCPAETN